LLKFNLPVLNFDNLSAATLELYFYDANSFAGDNAQGIHTVSRQPHQTVV